MNFTPVVRTGYALAIPMPGTLRCILNSDDEAFGGSGVAAPVEIKTIENNFCGKPYMAVMTLPPLSAVYYEFTEKK